MGVSGAAFQPEDLAWPTVRSSGTASSRAAQQGLWDANGPLGMLNGAFLLQQRLKMRGERNFSFEVSLGEDQTMVV